MNWSKKPPRPSLLLLSFSVFALLGYGFHGDLIHPVHRDTTPLAGDCSTADIAVTRTIFFVDSSTRTPTAGVWIDTPGGSQITNSTGVAVVAGGNFTDFTVEFSGSTFHGSLSGHQPPMVCIGSSYYRVVWLEATSGVSDGTPARQPAGA